MIEITNSIVMSSVELMFNSVLNLTNFTNSVTFILPVKIEITPPKVVDVLTIGLQGPPAIQ